MSVSSTRAHPQKSLLIKEFWPCMCCNLYVVKIAGDAAALSALHTSSRWAHSCSFAQVASLWPWETRRLYTPSDCFQCRPRRWPSCLIAEFHLSGPVQNLHIFFAYWISMKTFIHIPRFSVHGGDLKIWRKHDSVKACFPLLNFYHQPLFDFAISKETRTYSTWHVN